MNKFIILMTKMQTHFYIEIFYSVITWMPITTHSSTILNKINTLTYRAPQSLHFATNITARVFLPLSETGNISKGRPLLILDYKESHYES